MLMQDVNLTRYTLIERASWILKDSPPAQLITLLKPLQGVQFKPPIRPEARLEKSHDRELLNSYLRSLIRRRLKKRGRIPKEDKPH